MGTIPEFVQPGDFFCVFTGFGVSKLVTLGEFLNGDRFARTPGRNFSHAGVAVAVTKGLSGPLVTIVEAAPGDVRRIPWHYDGSAIVLWSTGVMEPKDRRAVVTKAEQMAAGDTDYGWPNYLAIGLKRLHIPVPFLNAYIASDRTVICSQVVDLAWRAGGTVLLPGKLPGFVTPQEEADLLMDAGAVPLHGM
jgi:hypothetical protein